MRKRLLVVLLALLVLSAGVLMVMRTDEAEQTMDFDEFFAQSAFFPADFVGRAYVDGRLRAVDVSAERKDGVLYVSSVMLKELLSDNYQLVSYGTDGDELISFNLSAPQKNAWCYVEGEPVTFKAWVGQKRCLVGGVEKTLQYAPYRVTSTSGMPYVMLPFQEVCRVLDRPCIDWNGLIMATKQSLNEEWLVAQKDVLAQIKMQLSQPFAGENSYYLTMENGHVLLNGSSQEPLSAVPKPIILCQVQDSQQTLERFFDCTEEAVTNIVLQDIASGQNQYIAALPNVKVGQDDRGKALYRFYRNPRYYTAPNGYVINVQDFGGNAQNSCDHLFYCTNDGQVVCLSKKTVGDFVLTKETLYYSLAHNEAAIGGQRGLLYRYQWGDVAPAQIGQKDLSYRQMAYLSDEELIVAASPIDERRTIQLYKLNTTSGEQQLLTEKVIAPLPMSGGVYFQINDGAVWYHSASDKTLCIQSLAGGACQMVDTTGVKGQMQIAAGGFYFVGMDDHLYWMALNEQNAVDISGCIVGEILSDGQRIFYDTDGYKAGVYMVENGQTTELLSQMVKSLAMDDQGELVILPWEACDHYYVYDQGKLQTLSVSQ